MMETPSPSGFTAVLVRELHRLTHKKTLLILSFFFPVLLTVFFGLVFQRGQISEIPVLVLDQDRSELSATIIRFMDATASMRISGAVHSSAELQERLLSGEAIAAVTIPKMLDRDIKKGKPVYVTVTINSTNLIHSNLIMKDAKTVIKTVSGGVLLKKLRSAGMLNEQSMNRINPLKLETQVLYNPTYSYAVYLTPGIALVMLQMIIMMVAVLLISSEHSHDTFQQLAQLSGYSAWNIFAGKIIPHFTIMLINYLVIVFLLLPIFGSPVPVQVLPLIVLGIVFIGASLLVGLAIGSIVHNQMIATEVSLFLNTPAFIFSGLTFPLWGMPALHSAFAQIIPYTHFLEAFIKLFYMETDLHMVTKELQVLSLFFLTGVIVAFTGISVSVRKSEKEEMIAEN